MDVLLLREEYDEASAPVANGRTLTIGLFTIGRVYTIGRKGGKALRERIVDGAFKGPMARPSGVLRYRHIGERDGEDDSLDNIHGVMTRMWQDGDRVLSDWEVFPGETGDKILRIAPAVKGASISAIVRESRRTSDARGELTEILRVSAFNGASLTPTPAYDDAAVLAVREKDQAPDPMAESHRKAAVDAERAAIAEARRLLG